MNKYLKLFLHTAVALAVLLCLIPAPAAASQTEAVAVIGQTGYATLQEALAAARDGDTVTLVADVAEVVVYTGDGELSVTVDGDGHSFSGIIYVGDGEGEPVGALTVKNCAFSNRWQHYALELLPGANAVTVEGCTAQGYKYGLMMVSSPTARVKVCDTQVQNVSYGAVIDACTEAVFENMTVRNAEYGIAAMNTQENAITVDGCSFDNVKSPLYVEEMDEATVTFTFLGVTDLGMYESVDEETYETALLPACLPESDYARIVAAARIGTGVYGQLLPATEALASGQTLTLLADARVEELALSTGKSLDLNGHTLSAELFVAFKGASILDSSGENTGLLAVAADNAVLPGDNARLPLWDGSGYRFVQLLGCDLQQETTDSSVAYSMLAYFEPLAHPWLPNGRVQIVLRLTSGDARQDYVFPAATVQAVIDSYLDGTYGQRFRAVVKHTTDSPVTASLVLRTQAGTEICCPIP